MKFLPLIFTLFFMNLCFSQNFDGKWILTKNSDTYLVSKINLFEFKDGKIISYDLEKALFTHNYSLTENEIFVEEKSFGSFKFLNENRFTLFNENEIGKAEIDFVRLENTKTELTEKEIGKLTFENSESEINIAFNVELQKTVLLEISSGKYSKKMQLNKIEETYVIFNYEDGELDSIIPIKEVNNEFMVIYGFSREEPYSLKLIRKQ